MMRSIDQHPGALAQSHAELSEMERIAGPPREIDPLLLRFDPDRHGQELERKVRTLRENRIRRDEEGFLLPEEIDDLIGEQEPDWDLRGLDPD